MDQKGQKKQAVMIHRTILGSMERFFGVLIEHYNGAFPTWLTPVQTKVLPIAERHLGYANEVVKILKNEEIRAELDDQINAPELRVIGANGKQLGVLKLRQALDKANEAGLDLVEIAPNAKPPVVKIVELGKFKYEQEKRLQKKKRATKASEIKEVRFSPFIAEHDFQNRIAKIRDFLADKQKVRVVVKFTGRTNCHR